MDPYLFFGIGALVGCIGALVGAGGGFLLVPLLVMILPEAAPEQITSISMLVVLFNALSGTVAYAALRKIHYQSGWKFALACIPAAFIGTRLTSLISRGSFSLMLGCTLISVAVLIFARARRAQPVQSSDRHPPSLWPAESPRLVRWGIGISVGIGLVSSLLGIGGGIIYVPTLIYVLRFPIHTATATSQFVLLVSTAVAVAEHWRIGSYVGADLSTLTLVVGAIFGAQAGARLSPYISGEWIVRVLAAVMMAIGARMIWLR